MNNKKGFILSTYVYMLLVFFLLLLGTMLVVLNNTKLLSDKLKDQTNEATGLSDKDFSFVLLGEGNMVIRKGEEYIEPGFKIQTSKKKDLSDIVKITGNVDIDLPGTYKLTYAATYNGITKKLTRSVIVLDNVLSTYVSDLYQYKKDENGLIKDDTVDKNIRYAGSNDSVKNYVEFGNTDEIWRIIGIFDVSNGATTEKRVKLINTLSTISVSWDSSASDLNSGYGINQWGEIKDENGNIIYEGADLMRELNTLYLNQETGYCCKASNQGVCNEETFLCDFSASSEKYPGISVEFRDMIDNVVWNVGAVELTETLSANTSYNEERGEKNGRACTPTPEWETDYCTDTLERTTTWKGKIGLIYPSDYGYASTNVSCRVNMADTTNLSCTKNNWLNIGSYRTITPSYETSRNANRNFRINSGYVSVHMVASPYAIKPSLYLKPTIKVIGGDGTEDNPYKLSI